MTNTEVDQKSALQRFLRLTEIPGGSGDEAAVAADIVKQLSDLGINEGQIRFDGAEKRTRLKGNCGNLFVSLPGNGKGPRTLLSAHMDTVPICIGSQPIVDGDRVRSSVATGLGADDRSGCAAILTAVAERMKLGDEHFSPAVIGFFVQEEIGLEGARNLDPDCVGPVDRAFNFDGGTVEKVTVGAIGGERMNIRMTGIPAHAGVAPENGASAIVMSARAIAELDANGWLGKIENAHGVGTANVGVINGGDATNVVTPEVLLRAEARSHDAAMRSRIVSEIKDAFQRAAEAVKAINGEAGSIEFDSHVDYDAFELPDDHPSVLAAMASIRAIGREPYCEVANGGLDANWLFEHGIHSVTLGCGQRNIHTADEWLDIDSYQAACLIAKALITERGV